LDILGKLILKILVIFIFSIACESKREITIMVKKAFDKKIPMLHILSENKNKMI